MLMGVVLHIPHSSQVIPGDVREQFVVTDEALAAELLAMTDSHTAALFDQIVPGAIPVVFPVSRLVVDPERFRDDGAEPMSRVGMGVIYTRTATGRTLRRNLSPSERDGLLARFYDPHHATLTAAVEAALPGEGVCLILDCHSFPSVPLPYEADQNPSRPDICIGTDPHHMPAAFVTVLQQTFQQAGLTTAINHPFAGALVPMKHLNVDLRVRSVMVEVNRRLYMDERTGEQCSQFGSLRKTLKMAIEAALTVELRVNAGI